MAEGEQDGIYIDGSFYTNDDLTYREQRELKRLVLQLNEDIPGFDPMDASEADIVPAIVYLVRKRANPEYSMDEASELKPSDLRPPEPAKAAKRPTKAAKNAA